MDGTASSLARREFLTGSLALVAAGAPGSGGLARALDGCCEPFEPLSLDAGSWSWLSTNPADVALLRREGEVVETVGGYGLSWYTAESFRDFMLALDWRITRLDNNSGVFIRTPGPEQRGNKNPLDASRDQGHEVQIDERGFHVIEETAGHPKKKTGAIYDLQEAFAYASNEVGAWNQFIVGAKGDRIWVVLNGVLVNHYRSTRAPSGFIALQSFGPSSHVQFRNLRLARLR